MTKLTKSMRACLEYHKYSEHQPGYRFSRKTIERATELGYLTSDPGGFDITSDAGLAALAEGGTNADA
ncbi:hypothetical protein C7477_103156 [Phyllobacterium leguminum]|uniref:Uncharacterized protein n=1 Tax=Phyllobacterium leguminum TaxID=314237 RepID=A0A318T8B8_9HYPH|nr:hypothetical protein C7477_103156 [Phyllobacterium leguminum]